MSSTFARMRSPISECPCMTRRSSSVNGPSFSRRPAGRPIFPMSCTSPAEPSLLLLFLVEPHARGDVSRVDGDRCRVASRVPVSRVKCRNQRSRERQVRSLKLVVRRRESFGQMSLLLDRARTAAGLRAPARRTSIVAHARAGRNRLQAELRTARRAGPPQRATGSSRRAVSATPPRSSEIDRDRREKPGRALGNDCCDDRLTTIASIARFSISPLVARATAPTVTPQ